ncbi:MAG: hypothetical protein RIQ93_644 [Verrucomicrobiota bacterium]
MRGVVQGTGGPLRIFSLVSPGARRNDRSAAVQFLVGVAAGGTHERLHAALRRCERGIVAFEHGETRIERLDNVPQIGARRAYVVRKGRRLCPQLQRWRAEMAKQGLKPQADVFIGHRGPPLAHAKNGESISDPFGNSLLVSRFHRARGTVSARRGRQVARRLQVNTAVWTGLQPKGSLRSFPRLSQATTHCRGRKMEGLNLAWNLRRFWNLPNPLKRFAAGHADLNAKFLSLGRHGGHFRF